jgi:hypothetical protein
MNSRGQSWRHLLSNVLPPLLGAALVVLVMLRRLILPVVSTGIVPGPGKL